MREKTQVLVGLGALRARDLGAGELPHSGCVLWRFVCWS